MTSTPAREDGPTDSLTRRQFFPRAAAVAVGAGALLRSSAAIASDTGSMKYRLLGQTGISVSEIGFGSHLSPKNLADPAARAAQIHRGLELGINLFDVYDHSYHQFAPMSKLLAPHRDSVVLSLVSVWPQDQTMAELEHSLSVFGTDTIDLYRILAEGTDDAGHHGTDCSAPRKWVRSEPSAFRRTIRRLSWDCCNLTPSWITSCFPTTSDTVR